MNDGVIRPLTGAAAGAVATGAMSLFLEGARAAGSIDREPPDIITENMERKAGMRVMPADSYRARWIGVHTAFGTGMGAVYGAMRPLLPRHTAIAGALFGAGLWTTMYTGVLPLAKLYPEPDDDWKPRAWTIALGHLVYGLTLAAAFDAARCSGRRRDP